MCHDILSQVLKIAPQERISVHKMKYILDKDMIEKLSKKKSLNQNSFPTQNVFKNKQNTTAVAKVEIDLFQKNDITPNLLRESQFNNFLTHQEEKIKNSTIYNHQNRHLSNETSSVNFGSNMFQLSANLV